MNRLKLLLGPVQDAEVAVEPQSLRLGRFDRWSLALIGLVAAVLLLRVHSLTPSMSDTWYHLGVAKRIAAEGQIPGWDWWNYAPLGRPHLYPPALHVLIAGLAKVTGSVMLAGQLCAATFYPLALLTTWYCARRLLDDRHALLAILLMMTDLFHFIVMEAYIAGCLVNILMPVLMVCVLSRRTWWAIACMTVMYYAHLGFPHCVALGLLLFGLKYRVYLGVALKVVCVGFLFFTPWLAHVMGNLDWLAVLQNRGMPGGLLEKLLSLQAFNLLVLVLGFWGLARAPRRSAARLMPVYLLIGFLPILFSYGGRYTMHTMPLWAILGASVIGGLLPRDASRRMVAGVIGLTLLPWPSLTVNGGRPMPLPLTGSHVLAMVAVTGRAMLDNGDKTEAYRGDCDQLARWLQANTDRDEIIHVNKVWVADMISLLTDRRTDYGAWWECSKQSAVLYGRAYRDWKPRATFVYIKPEADAGSILGEGGPMPGVDERRDIGRFDIGIRKPHPLAPAGEPPGLKWRAVTAPGMTGTVESSADGFTWRFRPEKDKLSLASASFPRPPDAGGIVFTIECSESTGDLVFGVRRPDGADFRWPLSIPEPNVPERVRVVLDWTANEAGESWKGGQVGEVYFVRPPGVSPMVGDKARAAKDKPPDAGKDKSAPPGTAQAPDMTVRVRELRPLARPRHRR